MKKILFASIFVVFGFIQSNAQDYYKVAISGAIPTDNASRVATFSLAADFTYLFETSRNFSTGITAGYYYSFPEEVNGVELNDTQFIPIAGAARLDVSNVVTLSLNAGYGIAIDSADNNGGFYYAPRVLFNLSSVIALKIEYRGLIIPDARSFDTIGIGIEFDF